MPDNLIPECLVDAVKYITKQCNNENHNTLHVNNVCDLRGNDSDSTGIKLPYSYHCSSLSAMALQQKSFTLALSPKERPGSLGGENIFSHSVTVILRSE